MKIRSIIEMDNGAEYGVPANAVDVIYATADNRLFNVNFFSIEVACVITDHNIWDFNNVMTMKDYGSIGSEKIALNVNHIVAIKPTDIDLDEDNE